MKEFSRVLGLIGCLVLPIVGFAQEARIFSNEFLSIGLGARAQGMANSYTASTNDIYSIYWNPAGLNSMEGDMQIGYKHAEYFAGIANYDFAGVSVKNKDSSTMAFGVIRFGVDDIPNTLFLIEPDGTVNYDNITLFSVADYAFFGSYARRLKKLDLGGNVKVIHRRVGPFATAWGFGLDMGAQYHLSKRVTIGATGRDITSTFNAWSTNLTEEEREVFVDTGNEIPENSIEITLPKLLIGVNYVQPIGENFQLLSELGFTAFFDGQRNSLISSKTVTIEPQFGFEFGFKDLLFLRAGIGNFQQEEIFDPSQSGQTTTFQPNVGAGVKLKYFSIDYAFSDVGDNSGAPYSHLISLRFDLTKEIFAKNIAREKGDEQFARFYFWQMEPIKLQQVDHEGEVLSPVLPEGKRNLMIDIDGTVCEDVPNEEPERMVTAEPYGGARETINSWYENGHIVTFFTSRSSVEHREITEQWLKKHGFKYHYLLMDKPRGGNYYWIDNHLVKGVRFAGSWPNMGFDPIKEHQHYCASDSRNKVQLNWRYNTYYSGGKGVGSQIP